MVSAVRPDFAADAYVGQLWRVPLDGGSPRRITRGFRDTAPRLSPDGRLIGFLRATADGPSQLAVVPAAGGEPMVITDRKLGVAEFAFTPDSSRVVFTAAVPDEGRYGTWEGVPAAAEDARHITTLSFQYNGRGYTADQRTHVFVVDLPDPRDEPPVVPVGRAAKAQESAGAKASLVPEARQLTEGDFDHREPVVAAGSVIVVSARHEGRGADLRADLYRIDLATGDATLLTDPEAIGAKLAAGSPVVLWDDLWFRAVDLGPTGRDHVATNAAVWRMPVDGGPAVRLTEPAELDFAHLEADPTDGIVLAVLAERGVGVPVRFAPDGNWARLDVPRGASVNELAGAGGHAVADLDFNLGDTLFGCRCTDGDLFAGDKHTAECLGPFGHGARYGQGRHRTLRCVRACCNRTGGFVAVRLAGAGHQGEGEAGGKAGRVTEGAGHACLSKVTCLSGNCSDILTSPWQLPCNRSMAAMRPMASHIAGVHCRSLADSFAGHALRR